jgi:hypothetical protein
MSGVTGKSLGLTTVRGRLLTPKEIAPFLRVSERLIQDQMNKCTFPIRWYFIGPRDRVVDSEDLNEHLSKIRVEAGAALLTTRAIFFGPSYSFFIRSIGVDLCALIVQL